jgi:hypothetical protein
MGDLCVPQVDPRRAARRDELRLALSAPPPAAAHGKETRGKMTKGSAISPVGAAALAVFGLSLPLAASAGDLKAAPQFRVGQATFALCTVAACDPVPGKPDQVTCHCTVNDGNSVGSAQVSCADLKKQRPPNLSSRYYPIKSAVQCSADHPWAFCLDSPCVVDGNDPRAAECTCKLMNAARAPNSPVVPWVFVTDAYNPSACTTGIVSSATVADVETVTNFLKTSKSLPPFLPIHWLSEGK